MKLIMFLTIQNKKIRTNCIHTNNAVKSLKFIFLFMFQKPNFQCFNNTLIIDYTYHY